MEKKWNLQDIKRPESRKRKVPVERRPQTRAPKSKPVELEDDGTMRIAVEDGRTRGRFNYVIIAVVFFAVIAGGFFTSYMLSGAEITVTPRSSQPTVNAKFTAFAAPQVGELAYEIMRLEAEGERQVSASGQETVSAQATGMIEIFKTLQVSSA